MDVYYSGISQYCGHLLNPYVNNLYIYEYFSTFTIPYAYLPNVQVNYT